MGFGPGSVRHLGTLEAGGAIGMDMTRGAAAVCHREDIINSVLPVPLVDSHGV